MHATQAGMADEEGGIAPAAAVAAAPAPAGVLASTSEPGLPAAESPLQQEKQQTPAAPGQETVQQAAAAAGDSTRGAEATGEEQGSSDGEDGFDAELGAWLTGRLQRLQPDAELDEGSVRVLGRLLDEITARVLDEARRVNASAAGDHGSSALMEAAPPGEPGLATSAGGSAGTVPAASTGAAADSLAPPGADALGAAAALAAAQHHAQHEARRARQAHGQQPKPSTLTSLDIHKALKRVLPGEPSDGKLRPYLPAVTKQAWHLDKQSLKGIKRQKQAEVAAATSAPGLPAAAAAEAVAGGSGGSSKENKRVQEQARGAA